MLKKGDKAPEIILNDKDGNEVRLSSFLNQRVVVYFYPKDDTPACSIEAKAYADQYQAFIQEKTVIIGISKDSQKSHQKFASKYNLPFILLADPQLVAIQAYDVWQDKMMYGKPYKGVVRTTYVIDEKGYIEDVFEKVDPKTNAEEVLQLIKSKKME